MATIEERAIRFADATPDAPTKFVANKAYTRGATDQRDIDIKNAQRAHCEICGESCFLTSYCEDMQIIRDKMMDEV